MELNAVGGTILGCAVGDAIGLPYEGLSRRRGVRLMWPAACCHPTDYQ